MDYNYDEEKEIDLFLCNDLNESNMYDINEYYRDLTDIKEYKGLPHDDEVFVFTSSVYNTELIYIHYDVYESTDESNFLKSLIHPHNFAHIPFRFYNDSIQRIISVKLNDQNRLDQLKEQFIEFKRGNNIIIINLHRKKFNRYLINLVQWLFNNVWCKFCIHGDLTTNNLIFSPGSKTIYVIDWEQMTIHIQKNRYEFYMYILIDIYDVIESFRESFDIQIYNFLMELLEQIKDCERDIKYEQFDSKAFIEQNTRLFIDISNAIDYHFAINFSDFMMYVIFDLLG